jgi:sortase A
LFSQPPQKRDRQAAKRLLPIAAISGVALLLAGLGLGLFAFLELRAPIPEQVEAVNNPIACSAPQDSVGFETRQSAQPVPTESEHIIRYPSQPEVGDRIGTITLPTLDLSWPIFEGTEDEQLALGVGHYVGSVLPGLNDNSILSGHRTTVFNRIGELEINDLILVQTELGTFTYQVRGFEIVDRSDQTVIGPTPSAVLTLTTCYPFNSLTRTTEAFIVEADLVSTTLAPDPNLGR